MPSTIYDHKLPKISLTLIPIDARQRSSLKNLQSQGNTKGAILARILPLLIQKSLEGNEKHITLLFLIHIPFTQIQSQSNIDGAASYLSNIPHNSHT